MKVLALVTLEPELTADVLSRWSARTMSSKGQRLLEEALALPAQERTDLATTLLESLDKGVEDAWSEEIKRRVEDVESGNVKTVPWSEARKRILAVDIRFTFEGDVPADRAERAIQLSRERYCSVWHSLRRDIELTTSFEVMRETPTAPSTTVPS